MGLTQWETLCGLFFCFFEKIVVPILTSGGYVGLSLGVLLSQHHQVVAVDIVQAKVDMINNKKSPIQDDYIEKYLAEKDLNLTATLDAKAAYSDADFVVIAAPTNYDSKTQHFDTSAVEAVIKLVMEYNPNAIMVIKSTIPVGYTASVRDIFNAGCFTDVQAATARDLFDVASSGTLDKFVGGLVNKCRMDNSVQGKFTVGCLIWAVNYGKMEVR